MHKSAWITAVLLALMSGCETQPQAAAPPRPASPAKAQASESATPVAYIDGQLVTHADMRSRLIEAAGGQVLSELVLDKKIRDRLDQDGIQITADLISQEKSYMLATLSSDPDQAVRLLNEMRSERGLGVRRFQSMLFRNAALRALIKDDVQLSPALLQQAYQLRHGERYRVRIIVADTLSQASDLHVRAVGGQSFADLASLNSIDPSAAQGGLLSPISPIDATYPKALRQALTKMPVGGISDLIANDDHFIIMKLEAKLPADTITFEQAKPDLTRTVQLELQAQAMQQAARSMLADAKIVVLDPTLNKSWLEQLRKTQAN